MFGKGKKKKKKAEKEEKERWHDGLKRETKHSIWGVIFMGLSLFFILSMFSKAGIAGGFVESGLISLFGQTAFLVPLIFFFISILFFTSFRSNLLMTNFIGGTLVLISGIALAEILFGEMTGGFVGYVIALPFLKFIDFWASLILFFVIIIVGLIIMFNSTLSPFVMIRKIFPKSTQDEKKEDVSEEDMPGTNDEYEYEDEYKEGVNGNEKEDKFGDNKHGEEKYNKDGDEDEVLDGRKGGGLKRFRDKKFQPPPVELLEMDKGKPSAGDIKANGNIIKRTFQNFGISVEMDEVRIGPSVTQYALKPAEGVKLSRIVALSNDLSLALASHPIRIEAPIPGKSLVGIEVPNKTSSTVGLQRLMSETDFLKSEMPLLLALGRNVAGRPVYASMSKMPHLLVAGATGSGKSVCIHALMMSLLYRHSPAELQFLMIDPKRVELDVYNNLPYLLAPVITEAKKAIMALRWATKEMEKRYEVLLAAGARDIHSFHKKKKQERMPYIIIVIDELADIMATYPREFEASIVRLAQMSRAVGIHLVVSTQRPSVEVITGLIKANITTRIAFQVASQIDSRTILDMAGAEKLLGNGDMLFLSGDAAKPRRIQGSFVSEREVKRVVDYFIDQYDDVALEKVSLSSDNGEQTSIFDDSSVNMPDGDEDDLYEDARILIIEAQKASSSYLQRRLRVGYARAARLLDMLEDRGIVGPADGSKAREVLISRPESDY